MESRGSGLLGIQMINLALSFLLYKVIVETHRAESFNFQPVVQTSISLLYPGSEWLDTTM
jgi:hypothetical protein